MKYYRCIRDLFHYRYNGNVYNFRMGQVVPYTIMVQNNLMNFEYFGDEYEPKKLNMEDKTKGKIQPIVEPLPVPIEPEVIAPPKKTRKPRAKKKTVEVPVEVEIVPEVVKSTPKKRGRPKKIKEEISNG